MQSQDFDETHGSTIRNVIVIVLIMVVGVLGYMLVTNKKNEPVNTHAPVADAPHVQMPVPNIYEQYDTFDDGLAEPDDAKFEDPDEYGVGITSVQVYLRDLNGDGVTDRITRTHFENGNSHFTNEYKIELMLDDKYVDVTPTGLQTIESADCSLQKIRFSYQPIFQIEKIGRVIGEDFITPTLAYKTLYRMENNEFVVISHEPLAVVCDVADLFNN